MSLLILYISRDLLWWEDGYSRGAFFGSMWAKLFWLTANKKRQFRAHHPSLALLWFKLAKKYANPNIDLNLSKKYANPNIFTSIVDTSIAPILHAHVHHLNAVCM